MGRRFGVRFLLFWFCGQVQVQAQGTGWLGCRGIRDRIGGEGSDCVVAVLVVAVNLWAGGEEKGRRGGGSLSGSPAFLEYLA